MLDKRIKDMCSRVSNVLDVIPTSEDALLELKRVDPDGVNAECLLKAEPMLEAMQNFINKVEYCQRKAVEGIFAI